MQNDILLRLVDFDPHFTREKLFPQWSLFLQVFCYYVAFFQFINQCHAWEVVALGIRRGSCI